MHPASADLHPSPEELRAFVLGTLEETADGGIEQHLAE